MLVLFLEILGVMLPLVPVAWRVWREGGSDEGFHAFAKKMVVPAALVVVVVAALVAKYVSQTAADETAREAASETQQELHALRESAAEGRRSRQRLEESAVDDRLALQRIEEASAEVIALMRESDPDLSGSEALERVVQELPELRERAAGLEDQLRGLRLYREMAKLDVHGEAIDAIFTDAFPTPLMEALDGAWEEVAVQEAGKKGVKPRCDRDSLTRFTTVAENTPRFPFSHLALAMCANRSGGDANTHAERAWEILRHTTQIPERHAHHDGAYAYLQRVFEF